MQQDRLGFQNEKPVVTSLMLQLYELSAEKISHAGYPALAKETRYMNCRLSHNEAHKLKETIREIKGENPTATLDLPGFGKMTIIDKPFVYLGKNDKGKFSEKDGSGADAMGYEISFTDQKGNSIGVIHTGSDLEYKLMYDALHIRVPAGSLLHPIKEGESLKEMQQMMTILGLGPGMGVKQDEDLERSKVFLMTQVFSPQAYDQVDFEHSTYQMSAPDLKKLICSKDPLMASAFLRYENNSDLIGQIMFHHVI